MQHDQHKLQLYEPHRYEPHLTQKANPDKIQRYYRARLAKRAKTCSVQTCDGSASDLILHFGVVVAVEEILVLQKMQRKAVGATRTGAYRLSCPL